MKKRVIVWTALLLLLPALLAGCGDRRGQAAAAVNGGGGKVTVAASFYPVYVMLMNVTQDIQDMQIVNMTAPDVGCLHDYAVTPGDMRNLENADALVVNGAGMETFLEKAAEQYPELKIVDSGRGITLLPGESGHEGNPHIWVSLTGAKEQTRNIGGQLAALFPEYADKLAANTDKYIAKLDAQREKMHGELDSLPNRDIVTFHEAFPYFAAEFNLRIAASISLEPGSEPGAKELIRIIEIVKQLRVKALFEEPQYSSAAARTIAKETGSRVYVLDPAVTGETRPDAYLKAMDANLQVLKEALQ